MRITRWKTHLLPLLLLSLHSISVCLAGSCIFDEYLREFGPLNIATAAHQPTSQDWEPIRIVTSAKDLQDPSKYCAKKDGSFHERSTKSADPDCKGLFDTTTAEQNTVFTGILERAIALHTDRLRVQRAVGPLKIPDFSTHQFCKYFNVPAEHRTTGVANADMVLYVAYSRKSGDDVSALSLGLTCAKSAGGRPIAGALAFGDGNDEVSRHTVRLTAHQIAHVLGFSYGEMKSRKMIMYKNVRSKFYSVAVVKTDKTKEMTQAHYGCPTAKGMELEDGEGNIEILSHWERRNAKDELMAQHIGGPGTSFMGFYTTLTMAFFEDMMGVYKANFQMAEHMEYGHKAGCEFLNGKCIKDGATQWPNMFCDVPKAKEHTAVCTTDRLGLGACALKEDYNPPLPTLYRYFTSPNKSGVALSLTDYCPVVEQLPSSGCKNHKNSVAMPGSIVSKRSMCLDGSALKAKTSNGITVSVSAVCAEISCAGGSVRVKYLGDKNNKWHDCPEGKSLTPSLTSKSFESGTIKCPKYKEVCTIAPDGSSLIKGATKHNGPNDASSVPFGLIPSVAFLVLSFAGYLIA